MSSRPAFSPVDVRDKSLRWQNASDVSWPNPVTREWLCGEGSLTRLLKLASEDEFKVRVMDERRLQIDNEQLRSEFGPVAADHQFWSRQVVLYGRDEPWVVAHTLLPEHSELSDLRQVHSLGDKPLGEFLFNHSELQRSHLHFTQLDIDALGGGWGRKSLFFLFAKPILVAEFFLPSVLKLPVPH